MPGAQSVIPKLMAEGGFDGMRTFDQHLVQLVQQGTVTPRRRPDTAESPALSSGGSTSGMITADTSYR